MSFRTYLGHSSPAHGALLDPLHVVFHMPEVPAWANRLVVVLMAIGFPAVLIFAWVYEITAEGLKLTIEVPHGQSIRSLTGRRLDRAIIAMLAIANNRSNSPGAPESRNGGCEGS